MSEFDTPILRRGTESYKWDDNEEIFGRRDILPFWVADMDFATPEPILQAIRERTRHPVLGYTTRSEEYYKVIQEWLEKRHAWSVPREWLMFCPPSSIVGIYGIISVLSDSGDSIIVPTPNYGPLLGLVENNQRRLISSSMREEDGRFVLDTDDMKGQIEGDTRLLLLSNPSNPTGRVFDANELEAIAAIAAEHDLVVVSDEVHCDLIMPGYRHIPYGSIGGARSVTVISPNKTFNSAGIPQATLIIPDADLREKYQAFLNVTQLNHDSTFGAAGMVAAYRDCVDWLDRLIPYLAGNHLLVAEFLDAQVPGVRKVRAESTYLAWLDCRDLHLSESEIMQRLVEKGGVGLYGGSEFGADGDGFFRMNVACSRESLQKGLEGIRTALACKPGLGS
jgi:cystathionine beta-lyase